MTDLDNMKSCWKQYKQISASYSRLNEEEILDMLNHREQHFSMLLSSRMLMNFCISALMMLCCTGC
jgi:hypothetical protein